jgi:purine-nucleoside phosphorylase
MSTVPEIIVANHLKLKAAAVSVLTDECDPENLKESRIYPKLLKSPQKQNPK